MQPPKLNHPEVCAFYEHDLNIPREKVGRNDPCPRGSGKKYKKCCWGK